ncbi:MAG: zinc-dependent metalloprotease, partial [Aquirufa sp.]
NWIISNVFTNVDWLINREVVTHNMAGYIDRMRSLQVSPLNRMLSVETFARLDNSGLTAPNHYKTIDLFQDLRGGIWSELASGKNIDQYRRNLQKAYIERLKALMTDQAPAVPAAFGARETYPVAQSDVRSIVRGELKALQTSLAASKTKFTDKEVRYHLDDCLERVSLILKPTK